MRPWRAFSTSIFSDDLLRDNDELVAWLLMFGRYARSQDDPDRGLKRGQFDCTMGELARRFGATIERDSRRNDARPRWTRATVRAFCDRLAAHGALCFESIDVGKQRATRFTIAKYDRWQFKADESTNRQPTGNRQATDREQTGASNDINDLELPADREQTGSKQAADREQTDRETGLRDTDKRQDPAAGAAPGSKPSKPTKSRPAVPSLGEWPPVEPKQKWTGFPYPAEFETIWTVWRQSAARNPDVRSRAVGKCEAYRLILQWMHDGLCAESIATATKNYLRPFAVDPGKTHCLLPTSFYSRANPTLSDRCDVAATVATDARQIFKYPTAALRAAGLKPDSAKSHADLWKDWDALPAETKSAALETRGVRR